MPNDKNTTRLAAKIKQARKAVGLSQKDLAKSLNISDKAISSYEVGRAKPSLATLREISQVTYKPFAFFLNDEDSDDVEVAAKIERIERELQEIKALLKRQK